MNLDSNKTSVANKNQLLHPWQPRERKIWITQDVHARFGEELTESSVTFWASKTCLILYWMYRGFFACWNFMLDMKSKFHSLIIHAHIGRIALHSFFARIAFDSLFGRVLCRWRVLKLVYEAWHLYVHCIYFRSRDDAQVWLNKTSLVWFG